MVGSLKKTPVMELSLYAGSKPAIVLKMNSFTGASQAFNHKFTWMIFITHFFHIRCFLRPPSVAADDSPTETIKTGSRKNMGMVYKWDLHPQKNKGNL